MDVASWLRGLGLGQYAAAFEDNAVDAETLRELTAEDLKELGISLVGHRRKLLAAIAALSDRPVSSGDHARSEDRDQDKGTEVDAAERRQCVRPEPFFVLWSWTLRSANPMAARSQRQTLAAPLALANVRYESDHCCSVVSK
jgi:hypothetical protein